MQTIRLTLGDCFDRLRDLPDGSIGAVVSDPPYGLEFQGEKWDAPWKEGSDTNGFRRAENPNDVGRPNVFGRTSRTSPEYKTGHKVKAWESGAGFSKPGIGERAIPWPSFGSLTQFGGANPTCKECGGRLRGARICDCEEPVWYVNGQLVTSSGEYGQSRHAEQMRQMQTWHEGWLSEAFRVLQPGGIAKVFAATRTNHRLAKAMEAVGFEIVGMEAWAYMTGFPKSMSLSKAIDKMQRGCPQGGADPLSPAHGKYRTSKTEGSRGSTDKGRGYGAGPGQFMLEGITPEIYIPVTEEAKRFASYGTCLKPSWEPFIVGRKPLSDKP